MSGVLKTLKISGQSTRAINKRLSFATHETLERLKLRVITMAEGVQSPKLLRRWLTSLGCGIGPESVMILFAMILSASTWFASNFLAPVRSCFSSNL